MDKFREQLRRSECPKYVKKLICLLSIPWCLLAPLPSVAGGFIFQLDVPSISIVIPDMPEMKMEPHPLRDKYPHLRYAGDANPYVMTVMTPTADAGMTPAECAQSSMSSYIARYELDPSDYSAFRLNESTFLFEYLTNIQGVDQVHAHLLSAAHGTHCIDIHISRRGHTDSDIQDLHGKFEGAAIQEQARAL